MARDGLKQAGVAEYLAEADVNYDIKFTEVC